MHRRRIPLPPNYFATPALSPSDEKHYKKLARKCAIDVVRYAQPTDGPIEWVVVAHEKGIEISKSLVNHCSDTSSTFSTFCSTMTMQATVDEVARLFSPSESASKHSFMPGLLDEVCLYTLTSPSTSDPRHFTALRWAAVEFPVPFIKNRDACFLETHMDIECDGRKGWVRAVKSIDLPECPALDGIFGCIRMDLLLCGHVVLECPDRPGHVQVRYTVHVDMKGLVPDWIMDLSMKRSCHGLRALRKAVVANRATAQELVHQHLSSRTCELCGRPFTFGATKLHCRICTHVVCKACSATVQGDLQEPLLVCTSCVLAVPPKQSAYWTCHSFVGCDDHDRRLLKRSDTSG